jgi:hypothetical protein
MVIRKDEEAAASGGAVWLRPHEPKKVGRRGLAAPILGRGRFVNRQDPKAAKGRGEKFILDDGF